MTCIIGVEHCGRVYMGGDSAAVSGWDIVPTDDRKVFVVEDMIIGYTSSFRMGQLLKYELEIPEHSSLAGMNYLVKDFIPAVRACLKDGGYTRIENNREEGGLFLVGLGGRLYQVADDFQVLRSMRGVAAVGCGASYALGALTAMMPFDDGPTGPFNAINKALEIAGMYSAGVCEPYYVVVEE